MTREEYFEYDAVSRSLLMKLLKHPKHAKDMIEGKEEEISEALLFGDAFDTLMFDGREAFEEKFHVMKYTNPFTDGRTLIGKYTKKCMELIESGESSVPSVYNEAYEYVKTKTSDYNNLFDLFRENNGMEFMEEFELSTEQPCLTEEQYNSIIALKYQLLDNPFTQQYFIEEPVKGQDTYDVGNDRELIFQKVITWEYKGLECKIMVDIIELDHDLKTIKPIDLKTTSTKDHRYDGTLAKYNYPYQGAFYTIGLESWRDEHYPEYTIEPFRFIFSEKSGTFAPLVHILNENDRLVATKGGFKNYQEVKGIEQLVEDLEWHISKDLWDYTKDVYDNGFSISNIYNQLGDVWDGVSN